MSKIKAKYIDYDAGTLETNAQGKLAVKAGVTSPLPVQYTGLIISKNSWFLDGSLQVNELSHPDLSDAFIPEIVPDEACLDAVNASNIRPYVKIVTSLASTLSTDLLGAWKFDELSGTVVNDSVASNHGTNTGADVAQTGKLNKAYSFTSANSNIVEIPGNEFLVPGSQWSVNVWVYPTGNGSTQAILSGFGGAGYSTGFRIRYNSDTVTFEWGDQSIGSTKMQISTVILNGWHMLTMTYDGTHMKCYVDKVLSGTQATVYVNSSSYPESYPMKIGYANGLAYYDGLIDEILWYSKSLNQTEIDELFGSGLGVAYPDWESSASQKIKVYASSVPSLDINYTLNLYPKSSPHSDTEGKFILPQSNSSITGINSQTGTSYTLALADAGKLIRQNNASAISTTVPSNSSVPFPVNTVITIEQQGAGQITLVADSGVTLNAADGLKSEKQYAGLKVIKVDTNIWTVFGGVV